MGWKILKKRRWEGPYSTEELREMLDDGKVLLSDFILDEDNDEKFPSHYKTISELLRPEVLEHSVLSGIENKNSQVVSDFDREEVTRLFDEEVDSSDLLKAGAKEEIETHSSSSYSNEEEGFSFLRRLFPWDASKFAYRSVVLAIVVLMGYGIFEFMGPQSATVPTAQKNASFERVPASEAKVSRPVKTQPTIRVPKRQPARGPAQNYRDDVELQEEVAEDIVDAPDAPRPRRRSRDAGLMQDRDEPTERDPDNYEDDQEYSEDYREDSLGPKNNDRDEREDLREDELDYVD